MRAITIQEFAGIVDGVVVGLRGVEGKISDVAIHSMRLRPDCAFFALPGKRTDGHEYLIQAERNGASVCVVKQAHQSVTVPLIVVDDPLRALQKLATWWRTQITGTVVAVTGSVGKTATKDALFRFVSECGGAYAEPGSYNSQLGVALAILACPEHSKIALIEAASTRPGEMSSLGDLIHPDHVIVTNVTRRHESAFGSRNSHIDEILTMCGALPTHGWVLCGESSLASHVGRKSANVLTANQSRSLPSFTPAVRGANFMECVATFPEGNQVVFGIKTNSDEILQDVQLALSAAWLLGISEDSLVQAAADYRPTSTQMEVWKSPDGVTITRDVAVADALAVDRSLRTVTQFREIEGRLLVVLTDQLDGCDEATASDLASSFIEHGASVAGLQCPAHRAIQDALQQAAVDMCLFESGTALLEHLLRTMHGGDAVLIQTTRSDEDVDIAAELMASMATTRLTTDLSVVDSNLDVIRNLLKPQTRIMAVVKARAYGTNTAQVTTALHLQQSGVDSFAVAATNEGVDLRKCGIQRPILVLLGAPHEVDLLPVHDLTPLVYSFQMLDAVERLTQRIKQTIGIHVEVDTGMHRTGFAVDEIADVLSRLSQNDFLRLDGVMTHFGCADIPAEDGFTNLQIDRFKGAVNQTHGAGFRDFIVHAANTAATFRFPSSHFDMVRIGIGLHGIQPSAATRGRVPLVPTIKLTSKLVEIHTLAVGERVGYGGLYKAPQQGARIGIVPAGYEDCLPGAFSKFGRLLVNGKPCPLVGAISMDSLAIDLAEVPEAVPGSDVVIYGRQGELDNSIEEIADALGTIPYELMTRIGPRVQRIFTRH